VLTRPRKQQRLETLQETAQLRPRALRPARDERDAAEVRRECFDDQARFAVRVGVQYERGLIVAAKRLGAGRHGTGESRQ